MGKLQAIDTETGEMVEVSKIITMEQMEAIEQKNHQNIAVECCRAIHHNRHFIMYFFGENFDLTDLKPQTAARLMYLATWLEYDSEYLMVGNNKMSREQMEDIMHLKPTTFKAFLKEVTDLGYLIKDDNSYRLNKKIFHKGKHRHKKSLVDTRYVRVYIKYIRSLYEMTPQTKHSNLGYIFQLIPYINIEYNIICHNPLEKDLDLIEPMTVRELCEAIGYDQSHASRLLDIYDNITFEADGQKYYFCGYACRNRRQKDTDLRIYVNPLIFFAGSDEHQVDVLKLMFV